MTDPSPVTLITGGSSGIGAAVATQLLARGHRVAVTGRRAERLEKYAAERGHPDTLLTLPGDAGELDDVRAAVERTVATFGRLDHAIANAGYATFEGVVEADPAKFKAMALTNVLGPALLVNLAVPHLRETKGRIVLVGSVAGTKYSEDNLYGAFKWAVHALAENTRLAVTRDGIGVTLIAPGRTLTDFWTAEEPEGPLVTADQVADSIVFALTQPEGVDINTMVIRPVGMPI
ncbi:MAG TPA: SDR family NAD(P)-dependent oxidoreductase [Nocardioides sp.]|jgi:NADP-dependent 3-hydroxy acid dehydrogenase YdfG